ncbi:hypothetical protein GCM10020256_22260 [Streptomyces thermocoprophilus]
MGGSEAASDRGWLPGHPEDASDPRLSEAVEITRGVRPQGDEPARKDPGSGRQGVTPVKDGKNLRNRRFVRCVILSERTVATARP